MTNYDLFGAVGMLRVEGAILISLSRIKFPER